MNESNGAGGKSGYYIRLTMLLGILALLGGTLYFDKMVKIPANQKKMDSLCAYLDKNFEVTKEQVRVEAGIAPVSTTAADKYDVEHYRYGRALPFLPSGQNLYVVYYKNGNFSHYTSDANAVTADALGRKGQARKMEADPNVQLSEGGGRAGVEGGRPSAPPADAAPAPLLARDLVGGEEEAEWKRQQEEKAKAEKAKEGEGEDEGDKEGDGDGEKKAGEGEGDESKPDDEAGDKPGDQPADEPATGEGTAGGETPPAADEPKAGDGGEAAPPAGDTPPAEGEGGGKDGG